MHRVALEVQNSAAQAFLYLPYITVKNAQLKKIKDTSLWTKEKYQLKGPLTTTGQFVLSQLVSGHLSKMRPSPSLVS